MNPTEPHKNGQFIFNLHKDSPEMKAKKLKPTVEALKLELQNQLSRKKMVRKPGILFFNICAFYLHRKLNCNVFSEVFKVKHFL